VEPNNFDDEPARRPDRLVPGRCLTDRQEAIHGRNRPAGHRRKDARRPHSCDWPRAS